MSKAVLEMFPDAHEDFFEPTGVWRIYPDHFGTCFPIGISTKQGAWRQAQDEVVRLKKNAEYAKTR